MLFAPSSDANSAQVWSFSPPDENEDENRRSESPISLPDQPVIHAQDDVDEEMRIEDGDSIMRDA